MNTEITSVESAPRQYKRGVTKMVLELLQDGSELTTAQIRERIGLPVTRQSMQSLIHYLTKKGRLSASGGRRSRTYRIAPPSE